MRDVYEKCAEILGIDTAYKTPVPKRTRWNNRVLGNGRFPGFGLVRCHGSVFVVISRHGTKTFSNQDDLYAYLYEVRSK